MRPTLEESQPSRVVTLLRRAAAGLLALGVVAFLLLGANRPANPQLVPPQGAVQHRASPTTVHPGASTGTIQRGAFEGFDTIRFTVTPGSGQSPRGGSGCAVLARTVTQQAIGLMGRRSLAGFAGMVFQFDQPTDQAFYMKNTPMPLSIAWFDPQGAFIAALNMTPCPTDQICPNYAAGRPFQLAMEVPEGKLPSLGIGPGAVLHLSGACAA